MQTRNPDLRRSTRISPGCTSPQFCAFGPVCRRGRQTRLMHGPRKMLFSSARSSFVGTCEMADPSTARRNSPSPNRDRLAPANARCNVSSSVSTFGYCRILSTPVLLPAKLTSLGSRVRCFPTSRLISRQFILLPICAALSNAELPRCCKARQAPAAICLQGRSRDEHCAHRTAASWRVSGRSRRRRP
jgi:hypothetical protein